jgi:ubiquinone/menaquinone biosynthesis C-methylase UbiE
MAEHNRFLPALRWKALTPVFDTAVRVTARERVMKTRLLDRAGVAPGDSVLDLGAGTGTLAIWLKQRCPQATVTGLDADPEVLARARRKASDARCEIDFVEGFSTELPFANGSFDVVLSSLFFHHLMPDVKRSTLDEVQRVLKPGGSLHVADWGKPGDPLMAALSLSIRAFDGYEVTAENLRGALPSLFGQAGLEDAQERERLRTILGTLSLYSARKPV